MGALEIGVAVAAEVGPAKIVDQDEDNIRAPSPARCARRRAAGKSQTGQAGGGGSKKIATRDRIDRSTRDEGSSSETYVGMDGQKPRLLLISCRCCRGQPFRWPFETISGAYFHNAVHENGKGYRAVFDALFEDLREKVGG